MEQLLALVYLALFAALLFFGPLQAYLQKKKSERDARQTPEPEPDPDKSPPPADAEKMGLRLSIALVALATGFFLWKILTTP